MMSFLEHMKEVPGHRVAGMVIYPLNEVLATLVGVLRGADDWDAMELLSREYLPWLKRFLPFKCGVPQARTFRKAFRLLPPKVLEERFAAWVSSLREVVRGVVVAMRRVASSIGLRLRSRTTMARGSGLRPHPPDGQLDHFGRAHEANRRVGCAEAGGDNEMTVSLDEVTVDNIAPVVAAHEILGE